MAVTPVAIDLANFSQQVTQQSGGGGNTLERSFDVGPFQISGSLYGVIINFSKSGPQNYMAVYKSTDDGATWTEMDAANEPYAGDATGSGAQTIYHYETGY